MFHMDCSSIIQNDKYKGIYIYNWIEANSRDWNSRIMKAWYQQIQTEEYRG